MGTFHHDKSPLHGLTLVVETTAGDTFVGRCDDEDENQVALLDADLHRQDDSPSREEYLQRADQFGVWPRQSRVVIPRAEVARVYPLADLEKVSAG